MSKRTAKEQINIFCCGCNAKIKARLTNGEEIYSHRSDLQNLPFWKCDKCKNYVGCHYKTPDKYKPLGVIPTKELMEARQYIHKILDPLYKTKGIKRSDIYDFISSKLGWRYDTANLRTIDMARKVYKIIIREYYIDDFIKLVDSEEKN